eukprot:TRINITY_DN2760_c0_g1_i1.p1 TRINITY_DN2760_c0_g1~~TRINITY_DN2760_c0_g1_i1.p1  ORF type:complete len:2693 (+),score=805.41 TRINITY_DN2760_c0_g1_i1:108-8186(+)
MSEVDAPSSPRRPSCPANMGTKGFGQRREEGLLSGVPPLTVLRQTAHLFVLGLKMRRRYPVFALAEAAFPVLVVGFYCLLFALVVGPDSEGNLYAPYRCPPEGCYPPNGVLSDTYSESLEDTAGTLWFAIDDTISDDVWQTTSRSVLQEIMSQMLNKENYAGNYRWFENYLDMEEVLCTTTNDSLLPFAAITFSRNLKLHDSCVTLGRRMTLSGWDSAEKNIYDGLHYIVHQRELPTADLNFITVKPYMAAPTRLYAKKFLALQAAIDKTLYAVTMGVDVDDVGYEIEGSFLRRYPPPSQEIQMRIGNLSLAENSATLRRMVVRDQIFRRGGGPVIALSWLMAFTVAATGGVRAKQIGSTSCLQVLGLSPMAEGTATVGSSCFVAIVPIIMQVLILTQTQALINVDTTLLFVYLLCFVFSVIAGAHLMAVFFTNPSYTPVLSVVVYSLTTITGISLAECNETHDGLEQGCMVSNRKVGGSLLSPVALILGMSEIVIRTNDNGGKVTWSNLSTRKTAAGGIGSLNQNSDFSISTTLGMMVGDGFLYLLFTWYLSRVTQYGYKWYFPLQRSYWCASPLTERPPTIPPTRDHEPVSVPTTTNNILSLRNLAASVPVTRKFSLGLSICRERNSVLNNVNLDLYPGQVFAVLGSEGKSSFIKCLTGQMIPDSGQVYLNGRIVQPALFQYRMKMGLAPEKDYLYDCLTVYEHLVLTCVIKGVPRLQVKAQAESMAAEVELLTQRNQSAASLTPGQKKKLQVAMAFIGDSRLVFLDEPTSDMDPVSIQKVRDLIRRLKKDRIVVLVTSSMEEAELVADRITILQNGHPRCVGSSGYLKKTFGCGYLVSISKSKASFHGSDSDDMSPSPLTNGYLENSMEPLVNKVRRLTPSSFIRDSRAEIKVHVPLQNTSELTSLIRELEINPVMRMQIRSWSLKTNSLEDIYLNLMEEEKESIACPSGHVLQLVESKSPCMGSGAAQCTNTDGMVQVALYCNRCKTTMCKGCAQQHVLASADARDARGMTPPLPLTLSPMVPHMTPTFENHGTTCMTPKLEGQPATFNSFWQDTNLQDYVDNADDEVETTSPRSLSRSFRDSAVIISPYTPYQDAPLPPSSSFSIDRRASLPPLHPPTIDPVFPSPNAGRTSHTTTPKPQTDSTGIEETESEEVEGSLGGDQELGFPEPLTEPDAEVLRADSILVKQDTLVLSETGVPQEEAQEEAKPEVRPDSSMDDCLYTAEDGNSDPQLSPAARLPRPLSDVSVHISEASNPLARSDTDWVPISPPLVPQRTLPDVIFTSAPRTGASLFSQLCVLVTLKRYKMTKNNTRTLFFHIVLPLCFVVSGLLSLQFSASLRVNPALTINPGHIAPPTEGPNGHEYVTVPMQGKGFTDLVFKGSVDTVFHDMGPNVDFIDVVSAHTGFVSSGAAIQRNTSGELIVWYNASSVHVLPAVWNVYCNLRLSNDLNETEPQPNLPSLTNELRRLYHNKVPQIRVSIHSMPDRSVTENAMPVLIFGVLVSVGMAFISSGFAVPIVVEAMSGSRLLQQSAGLSVWVYWLGHYLWDSILSLVITGLIVGVFSLLDPMFRSSDECFALCIVTILYLQSSLVITYVAAHYFTTPWRAQAGIATVFLLTMTVPLILSVSITTSGSTFVKSFSNLSVFIFSPLYSLINAYLILANYMETSDSSDNTFYLIRQPIYGLVIQGSGAIVLLVLFEKRVALLKAIKKRFPRPVGFYIDDGEGEELPPDIKQLKGEVETERKHVERLKSCGVPADGMLLHQLRKSYKQGNERVPALQSLDLRVGPGEVFALLGPSGAGKTTTVNLLVGAITPSQGDAFICGKSILTEGSTKYSLGICLQSNALIPELTVSEHITFYATLRGIIVPLVRPLSKALLNAFDLHRYRYSHVTDLTPSISRRLSLLLAFIGRPDVLILDEPTAGMDLIGKKRTQQFMLNWMKEMQTVNKPTVLLTSHSIDEVHLLSTRLGILVKGRLRCLGKLHELTAKFGKGWSLVVRTPDELHGKLVTKFVKEVVPECRVISERHGAVTYQLPRGTMSHRVLQKIEQNKKKLRIDDYSLNQQSLEEVFAKTVMSEVTPKQQVRPPKLNIVMLIVGTRGDVQPFLALALGLARQGHMVRLATHGKFQNFVEEEVRRRCKGERGGGVEYFYLAGEPDKLMSFMIDNPDLVTLQTKKIQDNQEMMFDIFNTCWKACTTPAEYQPDVIIANPPVQCHVHIAERLQTHLQVHFTMPWTATAMYPHPFAATDAFGNQESYYLVEKMIWMGLRQKINDFRVRTLKMREIHTASGLAARVKVPHVYCISESLLQRPTDWGDHIGMAGYWFLDRNEDYTPPRVVEEFLEQGTAPVYIGFGSIVLTDNDSCTKAIVKAVEALMETTEARCIVQTCEASFTVPMKPEWENKLLVWQAAIDHTWLFPRCSIVVHHGGAGTVAAVLTAGKPMVIIPFFGDQLFWGKVITQQKLGRCIRKNDLSAKLLIETLCMCSSREYKENCKELGRKLREEDGVERGIEMFYSNLPIMQVGGKVLWEDSCYENQRYYPLLGWTDTLLPGDPPPWSDKSGRLVMDRYRFNPPKDWVWTDDWQVDLKAWPSEGKGFQYATSWGDTFHPRQRAHDFVRRRKWHRHRARTTLNSPTAAEANPLKEIETLKEEIKRLQTIITQKDDLIEVLQDEAASSASAALALPMVDDESPA